jgi:hypothetical protein
MGEGDWERQSGGDSDEMDGTRGWKDGATSGAGDNPKRVVTRPLAGDEASQRQRYERTRMDVPGPPHRRGWMKTRCRWCPGPPWMRKDTATTHTAATTI